jgi:hypothetical protein
MFKLDRLLKSYHFDLWLYNKFTFPASSAMADKYMPRGAPRMPEPDPEQALIPKENGR